MSEPVGDFHVIMAKDLPLLQGRVSRFISHRPDWIAEPRGPRHLMANNKGVFPYQVVRKMKAGQQLRLI